MIPKVSYDGLETYQNLGWDVILDTLPHRYPFLLVDGVKQIQPGLKEGGETDLIGTKVEAWKNITLNEPQFQGHFPDQPILPGVYFIEALAQTSLFSFFPVFGRTMPDPGRPIREQLDLRLLGVDKFRFRRPILPGERMDLHTHLTKFRKNLVWQEAKILVDGELAAEGDFLSFIDYKADIVPVKREG